jgi:hypothetical protein
MTRICWIALLAVVTIVGGAARSHAQEYCRIENPQVVRGASSALNVRISCKPNPASGTVRYPAGKLYLGVTLYALEDVGLRNAIVPIIEGSTSFTYVIPVEFTRPGANAALTVPLGDLGANTHVLVAVWDKRTACSDVGGGNDQAPDPDSAACRVAGATLGRTDSFGMPIPIDAWPRPICNVGRLTQNGFFHWVETDGVVASDLEDFVRTSMGSNDCWMRQADGLGLGYSVRQWRAQPIPRQ